MCLCLCINCSKTHLQASLKFQTFSRGYHPRTSAKICEGKKEREEKGKERRGCVTAARRGRPRAVTLQLRRITRLCMRYLVDLCGTECPY